MSTARSLARLAPLALASSLLASCGGGSTDEGRDTASTEGPGTSESNRLVATAADGTTVEFADLTVTCRDSEEDQPPARIVVATTGLDEQGAPIDADEPSLFVSVAETDGLEVELPHEEEYGDEKTFLVVFISQLGGESELSSAEELAEGTVEVVSASCDPTPQLELRVDGALASEVSDATVTLTGSITAD